MKLLSFKMSSFLGKTTLAAAALGFFLAAGAPAAKANDWDDCNRRISYTEWRYHEAVERFGPYSRDARHWEHERTRRTNGGSTCGTNTANTIATGMIATNAALFAQKQTGRPSYGRPVRFL